MIDTKNLEEAKRRISKELKPAVIKAQDNKFNRGILEYGRFDTLLFTGFRGLNTLRTINSGLNHVMAKIAAKNGVAIGFDLEILRKLGKSEKAEFLVRIRQDIKMARKAKAKIVLINYKDEKDAFCFLTSLGASTVQARNAI